MLLRLPTTLLDCAFARRRRAAVATALVVLGAATTTACEDETAVVAVIDGLPAARAGVSLCLTARRSGGVEFVGGYGAGRAQALPDGEVSLTFVPDDPSTGGELVLTASARRGAAAIGRAVSRVSFREGAVERATVALHGCTTAPAGALRTLATREPDEVPAALAVIDADADGRDDVVGVDAEGVVRRLELLTGAALDGPASSGEPIAATHAVALDVDGDCVAEIALAGTELVVAPLAAHDPDATVRRFAIAASVIAAGDVDGDARDDVIAASGDATVIVSADGADTLRSAATLPTGDVVSLSAGDLDGDGRAEVLATGPDGTRLWRGGTMPFERSEALPAALAAADGRIELGDFDDDGSIDAVGVLGDGSIVLARNRGDGLLEDFTAAALRDVNVDAIVRDVAIADVTGDCLTDLVLAIEADVPRILRGRPGGGFETGPAVEAVQCREVIALDADGDGHAEIGALTASGRLAVLGAGR